MSEKKEEVREAVKDIFDTWLNQLLEDETLVHALERGEKVNVTLFSYRGRAVRQPLLERLPASGTWSSSG